MSSSLPKVENARPYTECECAAQLTSGRAVWMAEWIINAALFSKVFGPDSLICTVPWWSTRMRSLGWISEKCLPYDGEFIRLATPPCVYHHTHERVHPEAIGANGILENAQVSSLPCAPQGPRPLDAPGRCSSRGPTIQY